MSVKAAHDSTTGIDPARPRVKEGGMQHQRATRPGFVVLGPVVALVLAAPHPAAAQMKEPKKLVNVDAVYPEEAEARCLRGVVVLEFAIGPDGRVTETKLIRSVPGLDQAAIDAVRQWVYEPTLLNGVAVPVVATATVNFRGKPCLRVLPDSTWKELERLSGADLAKKAREWWDANPLTSAGDIKGPLPEWPDIARQARVQGVLVFECTVSPGGKPIDVKVLKGIPLLDQSAIEALKKWQFEPRSGPRTIRVVADYRL
jgi:TonB family protein